MDEWDFGGDPFFAPEAGVIEAPFAYSWDADPALFAGTTEAGSTPNGDELPSIFGGSSSFLPDDQPMIETPTTIDYSRLSDLFRTVGQTIGSVIGGQRGQDLGQLATRSFSGLTGAYRPSVATQPSAMSSRNKMLLVGGAVVVGVFLLSRRGR